MANEVIIPMFGRYVLMPDGTRNKVEVHEVRTSDNTVEGYKYAFSVDGKVETILSFTSLHAGVDAYVAKVAALEYERGRQDVADLIARNACGDSCKCAD